MTFYFIYDKLTFLVWKIIFESDLCDMCDSYHHSNRIEKDFGFLPLCRLMGTQT